MKKTLLLTLAVLSGIMVADAQGIKQGTLSNVKRVTNDSQRYEAAQWSPDGSRIAFSNEGYDNLYVMNATGGMATKISSRASVGYMYKWSLEGDEILCRDTRWEQGSEGMVRNHAIWAIALGGQETRMTADASEMQPAAWRYAGTSRTIAAPGLTLTAAAKATPLKKAPSAQLKALMAKPEAKISFIVDYENLYVVDAAGNKKAIFEGPAFCPVLSPDGSRIAFNNMDDVCIINVDGTGFKKIATGFNPSWANNSQIVIDRCQDDGHKYLAGELYIINVDTKVEKQLTSTSAIIEQQPVVSPDGSKLLFRSAVDGQIYTADLY